MAAAPSPSEVVDRRGGEGEGINVNVSSKRIFGSDPRWRRPAISGGEKSVGDSWGRGIFCPGLVLLLGFLRTTARGSHAIQVVGEG